jgi:hypothetical protein
MKSNNKWMTRKTHKEVFFKLEVDERLPYLRIENALNFTIH